MVFLGTQVSLKSPEQKKTLIFSNPLIFHRVTAFLIFLNTDLKKLSLYFFPPKKNHFGKKMV